MMKIIMIGVISVLLLCPVFAKVSEGERFIKEMARSIMQDEISQSIAIADGKNSDEFVAYYTPSKAAIKKMEAAVLAYGSNQAEEYEQQSPLTRYQGWISSEQCIYQLGLTRQAAAAAFAKIGKQKNVVRDSTQLLLIDSVAAIAMGQVYSNQQEQGERPCADGWVSTTTYYSLKALAAALMDT